MKLLLCVLISCSLWAQGLAERLDRQAATYAAQQRFNGAVLVVKDGETLLRKGYGMANLEWGIPVTPDTKFRLGSITKQFTAMAVLKLEQAGKWKVQDPVSKYLPEAPRAWSQITIEHLLTHSAGIPNFTSFPDYVPTMMLASPPEKTLARFRDKPLNFDPGTKFEYSNSGYVLLGLLIEKVSGMTYENFVRQHIFQPLGMSETGYDRPETVLPKRAAGYEGPGGQRNASFLDMTIPHAAGSLYSTVDDLRKWDAALETDKLLPAEARQRMFTPFKGNYAYGWNVGKAPTGETVISHGGGINGFSTMITRLPEKKILVVTLANVVPSQGGRLAQDLATLAAGGQVELPKERVEIALDPKILDRYVGVYELRPGFQLTVTRQGSNLMTQATGQPSVQVFAESEIKFFLKVLDAQLTFEPGPDGTAVAVTLHQGGRDTRAPRVQ